MPPKPMFEKEKIVEAALELARSSGLDAVTARAVGERLGCSTRPIFTFFDSMEALQQEVTLCARRRYEASLRAADGYVPAFKMRGLQMLRFAAAEPQLFRLLFMRGDRPMDMAQFFGARSTDFQRDLRELQTLYGISAEAAERVVLQMWIHTHGLCSLIVTGVCRFTDEELAALIGETFAGAMLFWRSGDQSAAAEMPVPAGSARAGRMCGPIPIQGKETER